MKRQTGTFTALDYAGRSHVLQIWTEFTECATFEGTSEVEGLKELRTASGQSVNRVRKGEYMTMSGTTLRSDLDAAP
jgi:hypothetical protein